jgi:hypothetical protein
MFFIDVTSTIHRLRRVLRAKRGVLRHRGLAALARFARIDDLLGAGSRALVAVTGAGLIAFALFVRVVASLEPVRLLSGAAATSGADAACVFATIVVLTTVDLNAGGVIALGFIALVVAGFALGQLHLQAKVVRVDTASPAYSSHD